jgi:RsiW-degrading membrane proteinase PrsW (M82 family)
MIEAAFIGTIIPLLLLVAVLRHSRPMMFTFCCGMTAFLVAYLASSTIERITGLEVGTNSYALLVSPPLEELLKSIPLFYFLLRGKKTFVPFIYIFGMASGIGFAIEENLLYLLNRHTEIVGSLLLMILRSLSTCVMHGVATATIGFAFTISRRVWHHRRRQIAILAAAFSAFMGYVAAIGMHGAFNFVMLSRWQPLAIVIPGVVFVIGVRLVKRTESRAPETRKTLWQ